MQLRGPTGAGDSSKPIGIAHSYLSHSATPLRECADRGEAERWGTVVATVSSRRGLSTSRSHCQKLLDGFFSGTSWHLEQRALHCSTLGLWKVCHCAFNQHLLCLLLLLFPFAQSVHCHATAFITDKHHNRRPARIDLLSLKDLCQVTIRCKVWSGGRARHGSPATLRQLFLQ